MQDTIQDDVRIYIVSTFFLVSVVTGGAFLCIYMFQPEDNSTPWYPVVGIVLVGIPWIFWITTYMYRCVAHCFCESKGGNSNREHSSLTKKQSCSSKGSRPGTSDGDQRHVRFGGVEVVGRREYNWDEHGGESSQDGQKFPETEHQLFRDGIAWDQHHISAASPKGEEPLTV
ncbi:hypothetical protein V6N13_063799 [Hibiscus sabdariffa]|uniref:Uncharacterized protein n=1 Tax=Hibiscus sabdariffa TaxID=183260 RepID=A0ABR2R1F3_9ROSI